MEKTEQSNKLLVFDDMCNLYVRVFRLVAVLPSEGRNFNFIGTRILTYYLVLSSQIHWSMVVINCFTTKQLLLENVCLAILACGLNVRFNMMIYKRDIFVLIFNEFRSLWDFCNEQGQQIVKGYERKMRRAYIIFFFSCLFVNVHIVGSAMTEVPSLEPNGTARRIPPFPFYVDNPEESWMGYWPIWFVQTVTVQTSIVYAVACESAVPLMSLICSGYFRHLSDCLLIFYKNPIQLEQERKRCIHYHLRLLKFCSKVGKFAETMLLTQIMTTGYNISLVLIKLVSSDPDKYRYISILCVFMCQLILIEWAPDYLYDESEAVALAAYSAYLGSIENNRLSKSLLIVVTRAQHPVQFLAGGFIPLSLESFGNMMKNAFSFFTVLRNLDL